MPPTPTLTIDTAAVLAGTTARQIKHQIAKSALATIEIGDRVLVLQESFKAWLVAGGNEATHAKDKLR